MLKLYFKRFLVPTLALFLLVGCLKEANIEDAHEKMDKEVMIDVPFPNYNHPVVSDDYIFLNSSSSSKPESVNKLVKYNIKTKEYEILYESQYSNASMQQTNVNNDWLVWVDSSIDGIDSKILVMNLKTEEVHELAESNPDLLATFVPVLYEDYVAWIQLFNEEKIEVLLYNLKTNTLETIKPLKSFGFFNIFISMNDNKLVWTDSYEENGSYNVYDLNTKEIKEYKASFPYPSYPVFDNGNIYSLNFNSLERWNNQNFGYYNLKEEKYHEINTESLYINYFDVSDNTLALIDDEQELKLFSLDGEETEEKTHSFEENPDFLDFDNEGNLILMYNNDSDYKIGVIFNQH